MEHDLRTLLVWLWSRHACVYFGGFGGVPVTSNNKKGLGGKTSETGVFSGGRHRARTCDLFRVKAVNPYISIQPHPRLCNANAVFAMLHKVSVFPPLALSCTMLYFCLTPN